MTKFTYNDQVNLVTRDQNGKILKTYAVIVGITTVETEDQSKHFKAPIGAAFYTIEFSDGSDTFVKEETLEPFTE